MLKNFQSVLNLREFYASRNLINISDAACMNRFRAAPKDLQSFSDDELVLIFTNSFFCGCKL